MVLPLSGYCDVTCHGCDITWHGCGLENQQKIERLQRRACRIVLKNSQELTSDAIIKRLGWKTLSDRREEHIKELVNNCLKGTVPNLFKGYFNIRHCDIHSRNTRFSKNLSIDKLS